MLGVFGTITGIVIGLGGIVIGWLQYKAAKRISAKNAAYSSKVTQWQEEVAKWQVESQRPISPQERLRHPGDRKTPPMPVPPTV